MKHLASTFLLILLPVIALMAQENELDKRNGFKDIKLATHVDSVRGIKFKRDIKEKNGAEAKLYEVEHADYESIGEVKVKSIEIKAYKNLIYEISVVTDKDPRLMKGMESVLGKPVYNMREDSYNWAGKTMSLKFRSHAKKELELLYSSYIVYGKMKEDKSKKIDDIANDF